MSIFNKAMDTIIKYNMFNKGDKVVIGVSGGADSVCLLYTLKAIQPIYSLEITVAHINHNLRGADAKRDEEFVKKLCKKLNINFVSFSIYVENIAKQNGLTLEETGRLERYKAFNSLQPDKIAVAHNLNDNCETMLMRLFRGSGIKGLAGISPVRDNIIRPLIEISRNEIEKFCNEHNIDYCTDNTNLDDTYTRNKIRLHLLPWINNNLNSNIMTVLSKTGAMVRQDEEYLDMAANEAYNKALVSKGILNINILKEFYPAILNRVIRICCRNTVSTLKDISYDHINMISSLIYKESGKKVNLPYNIVAIREGNNLKIYVNNSYDFDYVLTEDKPVYIDECKKFFLLSKNKKRGQFSYVYSFNYDEIAKSVHIRTKREGDVFALKNSSKKLKKIMIDHKIPVSQRSTIPIVSDENYVFCIIGKKINTSYSTGTNNIYLYVWEE